MTLFKLKILWHQRHDLWHWFKIYHSIRKSMKATIENVSGYCCSYEDSCFEIALAKAREEVREKIRKEEFRTHAIEPK